MKTYMRQILAGLTLVATFAAGFLTRDVVPVAQAQAGPKVYELRTYTAPDGKLGDLHKRFRDHTLRIFQKHGMSNVVYLSPTDAPLSQNTLFYLITHESREQATKNWESFRNDPEWVKVAAESQVNGRIVQGVVSVFATPTDYSPMK